MNQKLNSFQLVIVFVSLTLFAFGCSSKEVVKPKKPNVLFIAVDDLRPELNCYGEENVISPNIDKLANDGYLFNNSYCQVPVCGATRASLLSGLRPNRERFVTYFSWVEKDAKGTTTLPKHFKDNGYTTISNGKVFHHITDSENSWSEKPWAPKVKWRDYLTDENVNIAKQNQKENNKYVAKSYEAADVDDYEYMEGKVTKKSIEDLKKLKDAGKPFFLAVGYRKPHLPFNAPKKYWDLYNRESIPMATNPFIPKNAPEASIHNSYELRAYTDIPDSGKISNESAKILKHGYYACISYVDALIGELIGELKNNGLYDNTIIVLWGDHGFQLGEHTMWHKHSNYELSLNAPLIVRVPWMDTNIKLNGLTEFVDIYPTLCELTGLDKPEHVQGDSFVPLLKGKKKIKDAVFSRFHDGESVRTERYLYTEFVNDDGEMYAKMLYDHKVDSDENNNIVDLKENQDLVVSLSNLLKQQRIDYYNK